MVYDIAIPTLSKGKNDDDVYPWTNHETCPILGQNHMGYMNMILEVHCIIPVQLWFGGFGIRCKRGLGWLSSIFHGTHGTPSAKKQNLSRRVLGMVRMDGSFQAWKVQQKTRTCAGWLPSWLRNIGFQRVSSSWIPGKKRSGEELWCWTLLRTC